MSGGAHEIRRESGGLLCLASVGRAPKVGPVAPSSSSLAARRRSLLRLLGPRLPAETDLDVLPDEASLLLALVSVVRSVDPDILTGYEVQYGSWGYFISRGRFLGQRQSSGGQSGNSPLLALLTLERQLSRLPNEPSRVDSSLAKMTDAGGEDVGGVSDDSAAAVAFLEEKESGWGLGGRIMLNVWKRCKVDFFSRLFLLHLPLSPPLLRRFKFSHAAS